MFAYTTPITIAVALFAYGCASPEPQTDGRIEGRVTDQQGMQEARIGGAGSIEAASFVEAYAVGPNGELTFLAEATVQADGSYALDLDPDQHEIVLQAVSEQGEVVASAVLETTARADEQVFVTPMDIESSVEAEVFVAMLADGAEASEVDSIDLRGRIDAETAAVVHGTEQAEGDFEAQIDALADAIAAAQATEIEAYADAGVTVTQQQLFEAELQASQALSASLHQSESAADAYADFFTSVYAAAETQGADAADQADTETQASMAFRLTLKQRLSAETDAELLQAATIAAASHEAQVSGMATTALLDAAGATDATLASAGTASTALSADISAATTVDAAAEAYQDYSVALVGDSTVQGSILGTYLGVDATTAVTVDGAIAVCETAAATLDTTASADVAAAVKADEALDASAVAMAVTDAWTVYADAVHTSLGTAVDEADRDVSTELVLVATGSFSAE